MSCGSATAPSLAVIYPTNGATPQEPPASATTSRPGRPRRAVGLSSPTLNPLLAFEHADAVRALSGLLVDDPAGPTDQLAKVPATATGIDRTGPVGGTQRVRDALSTADAKMPPRRSAKPVRAA